MAFSPQSLPANVQEAFKLGAICWPLVVQECVNSKIFDLDRLASIVFYLHYPERNGKPIASHETDMIEKWKAFRTLIKPMVPVMSKPKAPSAEDPAQQEWLNYLKTKNVDSNAWFTQTVKDWIKIPPKGVEVKRFSGGDPDWGYLVVYKSEDHSKCPMCWVQDRRLQWFQEFPTAISYYRRKTGGSDERLAKILSLTFDSWNTSVEFYMLKKKMCLAVAKMKAREDGVKMLEATVGGFMGILGLTGARSLFAAQTSPVPLSQLHEKLLNPDFVGRLDAMERVSLEKKNQMVNP